MASALFVTLAAVAFAQDLKPSIKVLPTAHVEVGEEVFFSAAQTTYRDRDILRKARFEWDFGNGYSFRFNPAVAAETHSGIAVVHYFMKPGRFTVTLTVTLWNTFDNEGNPIGEPLTTAKTNIDIQVIGEEPLPGFEIQRAPFHNRIAQYLYVQIPEAFRGKQTVLRVKLEGPEKSERILFSRDQLNKEERILLDHQPLEKGDYVLIAELLDQSGKRVMGGLWRDKFSKPYSGVPHVGIDENNAFRIDGRLLFPIGAFMTDESGISTFVKRAGINILSTEGYYKDHTPQTWKRYLAQALENKLMAIGPGRGDYSIDVRPNRWKFNHHPERMLEYVKLNKNDPALFAWIWQDEPNMGGKAQKVYPPTLAAWANISHREDPMHPAFNLFYGYDWLEYFGDKPNKYDYLASAALLGGKKWMQDIFSFDIYPLAYRLHPTLNLDEMGPYAAYLDALDRMRRHNKNLVPIIPARMPNQRNRGETVLLVSAEQVYMEAWLDVIHGAKGIVWFPYFDQSTIRWEAMKKFADQMNVLAPVVLSAEPARNVRTDADVPLRRVDTLIREKGGSVYLFAARVTEPDPIPKARYRGVEPDVISVKFSVSGLQDKACAHVIDQDRQINILEGVFSDHFKKNAVHIYTISMEKCEKH